METQLKKPSTNSVGNWTPEEDEAILRYVYEKGKGDEHMMWGNLSETLRGRSGKSCRERWFNHLDPKIKRTEWSQEEQWVLFILRNQSSEKWSLISKKLMGRTDNAVKNYWNSRLKKRIDSMQHAVNQHFERKKKQKIMQMTQSNNTNSEQNGASICDQQVTDSQNLSKEQQAELDQYMERIKSEYLQKILDQVNHQNTEYFENLACEYTLQLQLLQSGQKVPEPKQTKVTSGGEDYILHEGTAKGLHEQISFMSKPDLIQMHLNILYKSVGFLSNDRILSILQDYKKTKDEKRKEEEKRQLLQLMMKKSRGRHSSKKDKMTEEELAEENKKSKNDNRSKNGDDISKEDEINSTIQDNCSESKAKKTSNDQNMMNSGKKMCQDGTDNNISSTKMENQTSNMINQPQMASSIISNESSFSDSSQSGISERQNGNKLRKFKRTSGLRKILRNLKKQKRQSRMIEKIFVSQKETRPENDVAEDPYVLKPVQQNIVEDQSNINQENGQKIQSTNEKAVIKPLKKNIDTKFSTVSKIQQKIKSIESERVLTRNQQQNALLVKKKIITKDGVGKIVSRSKIQLGKKSLKLGKKKLIKTSDGKFSQQNNGSKVHQNMIPNLSNSNLDSDMPDMMNDGPYYNPQYDQYQGFSHQNGQQFDLDGNQMGFPHITNNITNNNNYYSQNYNIQYNNVENVTQNFFINMDSSPQNNFEGETGMPNSNFHFQQEPTQSYMNQNFNFNGFQPSNQPTYNNEVNDYMISKSPMMHNEKNETTNPMRGHSPDAIQIKTKKGGRNASKSTSRNRSATAKNGQRLKTSNFFNQTMAQIVRGKDRELFPLVDKKKIPNASSFNIEQPQLGNHNPMGMFPPSETCFNQYETPSKQMMQKNFSGVSGLSEVQDDHSTQMFTPYNMKASNQMNKMNHFEHPNTSSPQFGQDQKQRFMTPQINLPTTTTDNEMQRFTSFSEQKPQQFIEQPNNKFHRMSSTMSFNNMAAAENHQAYGNQPPQPQMSRYRLPSTDFSADIMMKVGNEKNSSLVMDKRLIEKEPKNDLSTGTFDNFKY